MIKVKVGLKPLVSNINLPTVLKTAVLPGDTIERLFIATQPGEIFYIGNDRVETFLDIRSQIIQLGSNGGYDERGLLGLAFHPAFPQNGLFYLHYSVAGTQGPGALSGRFEPNPCDPRTLDLQWTDREKRYDHIDTVEEWGLQANGQPKKLRTLLNLRRPFANHNGVNSLNFSPETGKLVLTTGDGGSGFDPFNLSQDNMEILGKIIEIDVIKNVVVENMPAITRFYELPRAVQNTLTVIAKGVRNIPGIAYQRLYSQYIKYVGNVGQELVEAIYSFIQYRPIPVTQLVQASDLTALDREEFINLGWRGWEGSFPTMFMRNCPSNPALSEKIAAYYEEAVVTSARRLQPLTCYYHQDTRTEKFEGTALTGVQPYMGHEIPALTGCVVFTDFVRKEVPPSIPKGVLAYTWLRADCKTNDYKIIDVDYNFGSVPAFYVSLGANQAQTKLFLGVYGSANVTDYYQGSIYEIIP